MKQSIRKAITERLERRDEIMLAFVYGSAAAGRDTSDSDLDIAILFKNGPSPDQEAAIRDELEEVSGKEIDLLSLNNASPIIRMQVVKGGQVLLARGSAREEFFTRTVNEYDDLKYIRREIEKNIHKGRIYA